MEFKEFSKKDFEKMLPYGFMEYDDPLAEEYVYTVPTKFKSISIRIYSSVSRATGMSRGNSRDAIRIIAWDNAKNKPASKAVKRINRVFGNVTSISDRIKSRIEEILSNVEAEYDENILIHDWNYVVKILRISAHTNEFAADLLRVLKRHNSLTESQVACIIGDTTPKGYPTLEAKIIRKYGEDPDLWEHLYEEEQHAKTSKFLRFIKEKYDIEGEEVDFSDIETQYDNGLINREEYLIMKRDKEKEFYKNRNKGRRHK